MSYFPDLTPYDFLAVPQPNIVNVGWLCVAHRYPQGKVAPHLLERLKKLACHPVHLTRGFHVCDLCKDRSHHLHPEMRGNGEIQITVRVFADGTLTPNSVESLSQKEIESGLILYRKVTYASPVLIVHYIESHDYLPPLEFLNALEAIPD
jgi:hypothetical protein